MKVVRVETVLNAPPDFVWKTVLKYSTLSHIMKGLIRFSGDMPEYIKAGDRFWVRLWFFHCIPAWKHLLTISSVDSENRKIQSEESGGMVRKWNHLIEVHALPDGRTHYVDQIEIDAGALTPAVAAWAHIQYRYRQARWRRLAVQAKN